MARCKEATTSIIQLSVVTAECERMAVVEFIILGNSVQDQGSKHKYSSDIFELTVQSMNRIFCHIKNDSAVSNFIVIEEILYPLVQCPVFIDALCQKYRDTVFYHFDRTVEEMGEVTGRTRIHCISSRRHIVIISTQYHIAGPEPTQIL